MILHVLTAALVPSLTQASPNAFPIFLKAGFSSVLAFDRVPEKVVLGDGQSFQIERLDRSLVIRALALEATTNLFVYFKGAEPKLFILTASNDAEPSLYRKFSSSVPEKAIGRAPALAPHAVESGPSYRVHSAHFTPKKEHFIVEVVLVAGRSSKIEPKWDEARLTFGSKSYAPAKVWAERREVQRDTRARGRFVFTKPDLPADLKKVILQLPLAGAVQPVNLSVRGDK